MQDGSTRGSDLAAVEERLEQSWRRLVHNALAESTHKTYNSGINKFINFCGTFGYIICPAEESTLLNFIAFMGETLAFSTVKTYLSGVRFLHLSLGFDNPFAKFPRTKLALKGLKREAAPTRKRLPVTPQILLLIKRHLTPNYEDLLFWAATLTAFFGFLRVSEFTTSSSYDPTTDLGPFDIRFDSLADPTSATIVIKASKTDPFKEGTTIALGATGDALCPIRALLEYGMARGAGDGPLFVFKDGCPLTRSRFQSRLKELLALVGVSGDYTTHSLRIGAATTAAAVGVPDRLIKTMGRWASDAYRVYIRTPLATWARTSASLSRASI